MLKTKSLLLGLLTLLPLGIISAQNKISGRVLGSSDDSPIVAATVMLSDLQTNAIYAYNITNDNGIFVLQVEKLPDSVRLSVRAMNIRPKSIIISKNRKYVELRVDEKVTELKEVYVKIKKIDQQGDTINYNVMSFTDKTDRNIADILKKLPGIQVLSSGKILYQNKEISKFYIEGLDLLSGKYGIATNNIDVSKVATVQVLENHQPIKALKDMELPDAAAINLKLKSSAKGAFFATAQLGGGFPLGLLSNELVGMRFTRKQQNLLMYKGDNSGRDVSDELTDFYDFIHDRSIDFLHLEKPSAPDIGKHHYLFNNVHTFSVNDLHVLKKDFTLTSNFNFLKDKQQVDAYAEKRIFISPENQIEIMETSDSQLFKNELDGAVSLERNSDNIFLKNRFRIHSNWNRSQSSLFTDNKDSVMQGLKLPKLQLSNNFEYILFKGLRRYHIESFVQYTQQDQSLSVTPSDLMPMIMPETMSVKRLEQEIQYNALNAHVFVSTEIIKKWGFWIKTGMFSNHYHLKSNLYAGATPDPVPSDSFRNHFSRSEYGVTLQPSFSLKFSRYFKPRITLPLSYLWVARKFLQDEHDSAVGYLLFRPNIHIDYALSSRLSFVSNLSYANSIGDLTEDYVGYIMSTYRNLQRNDAKQSKEGTFRARWSLNYKNPFSTFFSSTGITYTNRRRNMLHDIRYEGVFSNIQSVYRPYTLHRLGLHFDAGQNIESLSSDVKIGVEYNILKSLILLQGRFRDTKLKVLNLSSTINTKLGNSVILKYKILYHGLKNNLDHREMPLVNSLSEHVSAYFVPMKKMLCGVTVNHYYNSMIDPKNRSLFFANFALEYKMKIMDILLDWTNLFNTSEFVNFTYNDYTSNYYQYHLRPSELLLRLRFKIL